MNCNCNNHGQDNAMAAPKIKHVFGNVLRLAIPLTLRTVEFVNGQIEVNDTDFIPSSEYPVKVVLSKGAVKISLDAEMRNGNVAFVYLRGYGLPSFVVLACAVVSPSAFRLWQVGLPFADAGLRHGADEQQRAEHIFAALL